MFFELASALLGAAITDTNNSNEFERQKELEKMRIEHEQAERKAMQKHETVMAILNGVNTLLELASSNTNNAGTSES